MVGEMRDRGDGAYRRSRCADGHLVLTTLHTNTAAGAITRLIDMGVESFLLASSVRAIVGQRLVRMLCEHCKKPHRFTAGDLAQRPTLRRARLRGRRYRSPSQGLRVVQLHRLSRTPWRV